MGCGGSKVDNQQLVILCKERKELIRAASNHRVALAAAHLAYFQSLGDVGEAIRRFVDEELVIGSSSSPDSPVLTLPSDEGKPRKANKVSSSSTSISHSVFEENHDDDYNHKHEEEEDDIEEGSHLHLSSGSGPGSESGSDLPEGHINIKSSPEKEAEKEPSPQTFPAGYGYGAYGYGPYGYGYGFMDGNPGMYYMKRSGPSTQSVVFRPQENHRIEKGQWPADPGFVYPSHFPAYGNGGFFVYPPPQSADNRRTPSPAPPPSPPTVSTWDYLNVFDTYDYNNGGAEGYSDFYPAQSGFGFRSNASSPDSREVREREGIPDLEEETEQEVVKEVYKENKKKKKAKEHENEEIFESNMNSGRYSGEGTSNSSGIPVQKSSETSSSSKTLSSSLHSDESAEFVDGHGNEGKSSNSTTGHETIVTKSSREDEEDYGRKKGVSFEVEETTTSSFDVESSKISSLTTLSVQGTRDLREVVKEIKNEFEVASSYGKEVAVLLEVSKLPYQQKNTRFKAPSMLSSRSQSQPSIRLTSRTTKMAKAYNGQAGRDFTGNLSSTLEKLYAWEKKLYKEVKDEEKLRVMYEEKCRRLKRLDHQGAESSKIDATRASIKKLLTKIDVCIRSVDSISSRIHRLRDEELQPQLTQLIHGLIRMWRSMLKCHQKQFQAIMESKVRSLKANTGFQRDSGLKATLDLEIELREWCARFNNWISTQKSYVESLNGWLSKCLHCEPEETEDGFAPFSPRRAGAPPIFIICKDWHEAMSRISGEDVANAMQVFASSLHDLWEMQDEEQRRRVKAEYISHDHKKRLDTLPMESVATENDQDTMSEKTAVSRVRSDSGISPLDDLKVDLDSMRHKLAQERARHREAINLVHTAASSSLKAGLIPIFEALGNFTSEVVKAHEHVRLQQAHQTS